MKAVAEKNVIITVYVLKKWLLFAYFATCFEVKHPFLQSSKYDFRWPPIKIPIFYFEQNTPMLSFVKTAASNVFNRSPPQAILYKIRYFQKPDLTLLLSGVSNKLLANFINKKKLLSTKLAGKLLKWKKRAA